jgi:hypothetical protein
MLIYKLPYGPFLIMKQVHLGFFLFGKGQHLGWLRFAGAAPFSAGRPAETC